MKRDVSTTLDMTRKANLAILIILGSILVAFAQESATPTGTPSPSPTRGVRISFVPPPLEGTISLGIYDRDGKLVRVLHQEAGFDEFTVEADGLETKWDGRNDDGENLPAGKYRARGYAIGRVQVEDLGTAITPLPTDAPDHVSVKLVSNPLSKFAKTIVDLAVGFDDENCFLKTTDGLPVFTVSESSNLVRVFLIKSSEKSVDVFEDDGDTLDQFRVSNIDQMMAFDCGEIELK
jgi:hypothetical protein